MTKKRTIREKNSQQNHEAKVAKTQKIQQDFWEAQADANKDEWEVLEAVKSDGRVSQVDFLVQSNY